MAKGFVARDGDNKPQGRVYAPFNMGIPPPCNPQSEGTELDNQDALINFPPGPGTEIYFFTHCRPCSLKIEHRFRQSL